MDQTICNGDDPLEITSNTDATGTGTITYQWQQSNDNSVFANITGATNPTYDPAALTQTRYYKRLATSTLNAKSCTEESAVVTITVNDVDPGFIAGTQTICNGDDPLELTSTLAGTASGTLSYQWQQSNDNISFTDIIGATDPTYDPPVQTQTLYFKRITTSTLNLVDCSEESNVLSVTVNDIDPGDIGTDQTICHGDTPAPLTSTTDASGSGVISYQWQSSSDNSTFNNIPGAVFAAYSPSAQTQTMYYQRIATSTLNSKACSDISSVVEVTVNDIDPGVIEDNQTICYGSDPAAITSNTDASGSGSITYQWQSSTDNVNFSDIAGATAPDFDPAALTQTTYFKRIATSTLSGTPCSDESNVITITINNVNGGSVGNDQTICNGDDPAAFNSIVNASGSGAISYQWESSADNVNFAVVAGATSLIYDSPSLTVDTWFRRVATSTLNGNSCSALSDTIAVTINDIDPGVIEVDQTICNGDDPLEITSNTDASGTGTITYQWQQSNDNINFFNVPLATDMFYDPPVLYQTSYFRRMATSTLNAKNCSEVSNSVSITVNYVTAGNLGSNQTICFGDDPDAFTELSPATGSGTLSYQWQRSIDNITFSDIAGATNSTYDPLALTQTTYYKRISISSLNGQDCNAESSVLTITVNPLPTASTSGTNTICAGEFTNVSIDLTGKAPWSFTYSDGTTNTTVFSSSNPYSFATSKAGTYEVIAVSDANGCTGVDFGTSATITVNPLPTASISIVGSDIICDGSTADLEINLTGSSPWDISYTDGTNNFNVSSVSNTYAFSTAVAGVYQVTSLSDSNTCNGTDLGTPVSLSVRPLPVVSASGSTEICYGDSTNIFVSVSGSPGPYIVNIDNLGTINNYSNMSPISVKPTSTTTYTVLWIEDANGCRVDAPHANISGSAVITVNPLPTPSINGGTNNVLLCGGIPLNLNGGATGGSGVYTNHIWTGDIYPLSGYNSENTVFNTKVSGTFNLNYTVTDSKGCKGSDAIVIENDRPTASFNSNAAPACGDLTVTFSNNSTGASVYHWNYDDGSAEETTTLLTTVHGFDNFNPSGLVAYYNVNLYAESVNGCRDTSNQIITVYPKVSPQFTVDPTEACQPVVATLVSDPGASSYAWDFGDGTQVNGGYAVFHEFINSTTSTQTYTIKLTTTSFYGCVADTTQTITVYPLPSPNFSVAPIIQTYPNATVNVTSLTNDPTAWTYNYTFGDGTSSTDTNPVHTYAQSGDYKITQRVSAGSCTDSVSQTITIRPIPPVAAFETPPPACSPVQIQFVNNSLYENSYLWDFGDGSISTKKNPIYTYFEAGTYAVTLTVSGPGGSDSYKADITVWATPDLFFTNAPDSVYVNDKPVKFFNYSSNASNYMWNFGDYDDESDAVSSLNTSTEFEPAHIYEYKGWKDVSLIAWNENCSDTLIKEQAVWVTPAGGFTFPNVFKPNPDGPSGGTYDPNDPASKNSVFYPGVLDQVLEYNLYIYNRWGEQIFHSSNVNIGWDGYYNGTLAKQGVYIWKVKGKYTNGKNFVEVGDVTLLH